MTTPALPRILYVEDEPDIRSIAKISLEDLGGFTVAYCGSGQEALEEAEAFKPDLFLLDVMMPGMDGPTTFKELKKNPKLSLIPAVYITAKVQTQELLDYKKDGVLDVITKPFDPILLPEKIKEIWIKYCANKK